MNVIFLDVDGPMIPMRATAKPFVKMRPDFPYRWEFDPLAVEMLHTLHEDFDARIFWNTTWNKFPESLKEAAQTAGLNWNIVTGFTQYAVSTYDRLKAIELVLERLPEIKNWVALDDAFIDHENAIQVSMADGISFADYEDARILLSGGKLD